MPYAGGPLEQPAGLMEAFTILDSLADARTD